MLQDPFTSQRGAEQTYGVWAEAMADLISYRYLGCSSVMLDRDRAVGRMTLRGDLRATGGLLSAPVAIAMLDTAGICIDRVFHLALTHIEIQLVDPATDVRRLRVIGIVARWARTQVFTEATFVDDDHPQRVIGFGTADWAVISPTPDGFVYTDPTPGVVDSPDLPTLANAYDATAIGGGYQIAGLSTRIGADTLHHGPIVVTLEATAIDLAVQASAVDSGVRVETASVRIVRAGRRGPFVTRGNVLSDGDVIVVRTELVDRGLDEATIAIAYHRIRLRKTPP